MLVRRRRIASFLKCCCDLRAIGFIHLATNRPDMEPLTVGRQWRGRSRCSERDNWSLLHVKCGSPELSYTAGWQHVQRLANTPFGTPIDQYSSRNRDTWTTTQGIVTKLTTLYGRTLAGLVSDRQSIERLVES